jgi:hypothetical protein
MKEFDFTLQVEDPAEHWAKPPDRYERFAEMYLKLVPDRSRLMFDVNVMPDRSVAGTSLPSALATGTELARTVIAAAAATGRAAIYSEYTVAGQDWALLGAALARTARAKTGGDGWSVTSQIPLRMNLPEDAGYFLDGRPWPAVSPDGVSVPPGKYHLSLRKPWYQWLDSADLTARILHSSSDLLEARVHPTWLAVRYRSPGRAVLLLNQRPLSIRVDGQTRTLPVVDGGTGWAVLAPRGEHRLEVDTATRSGVLVSLWAWASASAIAVFGAVTTMIMAAIYIHLRLRRAARGRFTS